MFLICYIVAFIYVSNWIFYIIFIKNRFFYMTLINLIPSILIIRANKFPVYELVDTYSFMQKRVFCNWYFVLLEIELNIRILIVLELKYWSYLYFPSNILYDLLNSSPLEVTFISPLKWEFPSHIPCIEFYFVVTVANENSFKF